MQYQELDISKDRTAYREMVELTHSTAVPQIYIDGAMMIGYNENLLRQRLEIK